MHLIKHLVSKGKDIAKHKSMNKSTKTAKLFAYMHIYHIYIYIYYDNIS